MMNRKTATALLSVGSNTALIAGKIVVGILSGSVSIISEAIHSGMDLVAAVIAFFSVRTSDKPADADHPYGHGKIENISGVIEALLILVAAGWIIWEAIHKLLKPTEIESVGLGFGVMMFSAAMNFLVSRRLYKVAKEEDSVALSADALHLRADVITSLGVGLGLLLIWVFGWFGLHLFWLDPVVAICVALFITKEAVGLLIHAFQPLLDASLPDEEITTIRQVIAEFQPTGADFHQLRTRRAGKMRHIDFHLTLPGHLTVQQSHDICDQIEGRLEKILPHAIVFIHVEPA